MKAAKILTRIIVGLIFVACGSILVWLIFHSDRSALVDIPVVSVAVFLVLVGCTIIIKPKAIRGIAEALALWM